ncbi:interleukin-10 receptor subunit alpha [Centropristis striata]|uniref:interleukin-10 receptor subunit alpha n=1 Tax=Centropristis striata TaxID=184440 RepID=UPI0027E11A57|nr:interleukin-10 receptor subunit alpha [Centropristis striata]
MITSLLIPDMDLSNTTPILVFLIININFVTAGLKIPSLDKLEVNILDGEVIVYWKHPADAPSNLTYNVQMAKYIGAWNNVSSCTKITRNFCDLSSFVVDDYRAGYKVRVQVVSGDGVSAWTAKRFYPNLSELQPPSFTLWATSSSLTVHVHQKPILKKLFPFGLTYTIYLEDTGQNRKNTTAYLKDDVGDDERSKTFSSLRWGREYCVSVTVEGIGGTNPSSVSPRKCLLLPEQEWFIIAVSSLSILGGLAIFVIMATILLCYLRGSEKTPTALKSPVSGWLPLSVGEGAVEVVTDKGWFLSSYRTEVTNCVVPSDPETNVTVIEEDGEEDRRTSMDSGVGMESSSATNSGKSPPMQQEDSGCGSLGGPESSSSCQTDYPLQEERTDMDIAQKRDYSGVVLPCHLDCSSINLEGQDNGFAGGNYRSQSGSAVQIHVCDEEEMFKQKLPDLAEVVTGYRATPQLCVCSGAGQCTWCHKQGFYDTEVIKQYRAMCIENGLLSSKSDFVDSYKAGFTISNYSKTQMDTVMVNGFETTFIQLGETFPLLTALAPLPLVEAGQDFNMNNVSLSLCDVQLTAE